MRELKINSEKSALFKALPSVQEILTDDTVQDLNLAIPYKKSIIQNVIQRYRHRIQNEKLRHVKPGELKPRILKEIEKKGQQLTSLQMKRVINATGIILHTNLGRAPLPQPAIEHLSKIIDNYSNLEIDLESGTRGNRISIVEEIICLLTDAEAAVVVNNNAAAILLSLNSLCRRKEVPVSRGELVEIGGSFRMPEVMKSSGAKMVEVGTTNKTHLQDYREAINQRTGAVLKVHTSNYRIKGFTQSVPTKDLVELAHQNERPVIYDMGSGVLEDLQHWGYSHEPVARDYIRTGVDVITFSGDKVLGGPQSGIIIGKQKYIRKIKRNHLLRALRCDKLTYALLDATLRLYLNPEGLPKSLPVARMLTYSQEELKQRADRLTDAIRDLPLKLEVVNTYSQMGSGALPLEEIPSVAVKIIPQSMSVNRFARNLRLNDPALIGYIENDAFYLNLRTVREDEFALIPELLKKVVK